MKNNYIIIEQGENLSAKVFIETSINFTCGYFTLKMFTSILFEAY